MAYQNIGSSPRFFIDNNLFLSANGLDPITPSHSPIVGGEIHNLSPGSYSEYSLDGWLYFYIGTGELLEYSYFAVLGHNIADLPSNFNFYSTPAIPIGDVILSVNYYPDSPIECNGWSLFAFEKNSVPRTIWFGYPGGIASAPNLKISSFSLGSTYTMPHSPDLKLTMSREYGGTKTIETRGGASLTNTMWSKPPKWGDLGAWELSKNGAESQELFQSQELSRSGRRVWDLSFSYLQDSDVFPLLSSLTPHESVDVDGIPWSEGNNWESSLLLKSDNFYSQVIHKLNGGQNRFLFQADSSNNNPDQFAIAKLDMNSFKFEQVANGVYNVKLKIREVW